MADGLECAATSSHSMQMITPLHRDAVPLLSSTTLCLLDPLSFPLIPGRQCRQGKIASCGTTVHQNDFFGRDGELRCLFPCHIPRPVPQRQGIPHHALCIVTEGLLSWNVYVRWCLREPIMVLESLDMVLFVLIVAFYGINRLNLGRQTCSLATDRSEIEAWIEPKALVFSKSQYALRQVVSKPFILLLLLRCGRSDARAEVNDRINVEG